jgi:hypothetical protein
LTSALRWRRVVGFIPRPLYPQGKSPWYPMDRRLGDAHKFRVFENRRLRKIYDSKKENITGKDRNYIMRSFMIVFLI